MLTDIAFIALTAVMNRARGTRFFNLVSSTVEGRFFSMALIGFAAGGFFADDLLLALCVMGWALASLMFWASPAWDAYWSAEIGNDPRHSKTWGVAMMALRMLAGAPCMIGLALLAGEPLNALYGLAMPILALPYVVFGSIDKSTAIPRSEYTVGALLGGIMLAAMGVW